ncbi:hypothetical protein N7462_000579 [Penicillium macrosclerotiorum]|uniref:uncharacterized protein n=1 Tax=Penicillium macrosclerotiorum TaxID=303699 RepID=UPI0025473413|nr:uncharacterized protein N7462_000579 [Penicillium macrosclerotiorum]KAJ5698574.1 hypothetical protein N7462_000579 [Penicillium macrosclerotiorum]
MAGVKVSPALPTPAETPIVNRDVSYPRWFGGSASCMAVLISHPFDLMTYGASRIALYEELKQSAMEHGKPVTVPMLTAMAAISGFVGAIFGTPSDIANIRMQNDKSLAPQDRRNYRHVFDAWMQMKRYEGWRAFRQGMWPNCFRCAIMTASQLASYDIFKKLVMSISNAKSETPFVHFSASVMASLIATSISSPMDVIRTQLMNSSESASVLRIVGKLFRLEGYRWIFRGWTPSFIRLGPQTVATLVLLEQHKRFYRMVTSVGDCP